MGDLDGPEHPRHGDGLQKKGATPELLDRTPPFDGSELLDFLDSVAIESRPGVRAVLLDATSAYTREKLREQSELRSLADQREQELVTLRSKLAEEVTTAAVLRNELQWLRGSSLKNKISIGFGSVMLPIAVDLFNTNREVSALVGVIALGCIISGVWVTRRNNK